MSLLVAVAEKGRVRIAVTALGGSLITITRRHPSGRILPVRGMNKAPLSGGAFLGWDYEMPIGVPVTYLATTWADPDTIAGISEAESVTWDTTAEWLKDPLEPARNIQVHISDMGAYNYSMRTGVHPVLDRPDPITVGEIRAAAAGDLILVTLDREERDRLHYITASGHALLLQSTQESGVGNMYIAPVGDMVEARVGPRDEQTRTWTLPYVEVAMPVGAGASFVTYQDLLDSFADYQAVLDSAPDYMTLIENLQSTLEPPVLTWRGA